MRLASETERSIHRVQRRKITKLPIFPLEYHPRGKITPSLKEMSPSSSDAKLADNAAKISYRRVYAKCNQSGTTRYEQLKLRYHANGFTVTTMQTTRNVWMRNVKANQRWQRAIKKTSQFLSEQCGNGQNTSDAAKNVNTNIIDSNDVISNNIGIAYY